MPAAAARLEAARRVGLAADLRPAFVAYGAAREQLELLFQGALCVTTGQQPGLLTGPLYTVYKALSAAALAQAAAAHLGAPVVPVFWVAGDDHDFAEANHAYTLGKSGEIEHLVLREREASAPSTPLYQEPAGPEIARVLDTLETTLPDTEFRDRVLAWLRRHYRPQANLAEAFTHALGELLGELGIILFESTHVAAKRAMAPWLMRLLQRAGPLNREIESRAAQLQVQGRPAPVSVGDGATPVMVEGPIGRERLMLDDGAFVARRSGQRWSYDELEKLARTDPQRLSPNVLGRPAVEAAILPTLAYVGGPGELAYFPQADPIYRALEVVPQPPVARWSGRVLEPKVVKVLTKYGIDAESLEQPEGRLEGKLVAGDLPADARAAIATLRETLLSQYDRLADAAVTVDSTLRKPVESAKNAALGGATDIEKRIVAHLKKRNETLLQQLDKARRNLFPLGQPQERIFTVATYLARYGPAFLDAVFHACLAHVETLETRSVGA